MGRCIQPEIAECNYSSRSRPVCGSDGLTYLNAAMLACRNQLRSTQRNLPFFTTYFCECQKMLALLLGLEEALHFSATVKLFILFNNSILSFL